MCHCNNERVLFSSNGRTSLCSSDTRHHIHTYFPGACSVPSSFDSLSDTFRKEDRGVLRTPWPTPEGSVLGKPKFSWRVHAAAPTSSDKSAGKVCGCGSERTFCCHVSWRAPGTAVLSLEGRTGSVTASLDTTQRWQVCSWDWKWKLWMRKIYLLLANHSFLLFDLFSYIYIYI